MNVSPLSVRFDDDNPWVDLAEACDANVVIDSSGLALQKLEAT